MYAKDDVRSRLNGGTATKANDPSLPVADAEYRDFRDSAPESVSALGSKTWMTRGQNCIVSWTDAANGEVLSIDDQADEYAVLCVSGSAPIRVRTDSESVDVDEDALVVVPPGSSVLEVLAAGAVIRVFSSRNETLAQAADNADRYRIPDSRCAPLEPWPDPVGGFKLRVYRLAQVPDTPGRFGRIFRTTNLMVNFLPEESTPRDPQKLSPHHHDDFEQLSLATQGRYIHHIRYPWGPRSDLWRDDEHVATNAPSIAVIPPPTEHTSQGVGSHQQLIDIFSPPRQDFSAQPGWVLNADDYPAR
jgi:hypothetical protein